MGNLLKSILDMSSKQKLKGKCFQCGTCCKAIYLSLPPQEMLGRYSYEIGKLCEYEHDDRTFVFKNFYPIPRWYALQINPFLENWIKHKSGNNKHYFYKCRQYDDRNNKCLSYNHRTGICINYPWYSGIKNIEIFYTENCGYKIDSELSKLISIMNYLGAKRNYGEPTIEEQRMFFQNIFKGEKR